MNTAANTRFICILERRSTTCLLTAGPPAESAVRDMLAERVKEWTREWKTEGEADIVLRQLRRRFKRYTSIFARVFG